MPAAPPAQSGKRAPPKLDLRAFQSSTPTTPRRNFPRHLVDTHMHLWTHEQLATGSVKWPTNEGGLPQLVGPHELAAYGAVVNGGIKLVGGGKSEFRGVVFHDDDDVDGSKGGWDAALSEVDSVCSAALDSTVPLLALVPWAPVHHGRAALALFQSRLLALPSLQALAERLGYAPVKSFRYLLQDSPPGFFQSDSFVDGLKWLGENGYAFDMTLDVTHEETGRTRVLEDAIDAIERVRVGQEGAQQTVFILDHCAKPPLTADPSYPPAASLTAYIAALYQLALLPNVYLKLSALLDSADRETVAAAFAEFSSGEYRRKRKDGAYDRLRSRIGAVLEPAVEAFGESRILSAAWAFEMQLYLDCLTGLGLEGDALDALFEGNARVAYKLGGGAAAT
ncbi:uncharacterized protein RHOBADRAFT_44246 [Rhodotorula graminis WP1]|uniref:Amidohydrolase-related domain-containing protein n=1 Tax=Rhodotorula graminis (strain WP1) TaxID=578459 RepID=A0A194S5M9_RHOGW|nr:uncharacterized protein RHOBADRAFT_44246 [Rhodotorula graminis WP1]KPV74726.1 hypothetical protein RHOBADRAFT_44246 [Rhodotorula graminis WP1]